MNDDNEVDRGLAADLAALRGALRDVRASDADERSLMAALRTRRLASEAAPAAAAERAAAVAPRAARRWRAPFALAAAAALAAVTAVVTLRVEQGGGRPELPDSSAVPGAAESSEAPAVRQDFTSAFQPLPFSSGLSMSQSYSVVRVRIPLTALTPGYSAPLDATIEADLLVGEDGLASGIRFNRADTVSVSTASNEMGEPR